MTMMMNTAVCTVDTRREAVRDFMTKDYVVISVGISVREAMRSLIAQAGERDNVSVIYVVDGAGRLLGSIDLPQLIRARESDTLESLMDTDITAVHADEDAEDCAERLRAVSLESVPVTDEAGKLCGVLTSPELARLAGEAMEEDYARLGGLSEEEDLREPLRRSVHKRLPWLLMLLGLGLVVSSVVGAFERVVAHLTLIVSFQSLVLDMAGNVGTQSLAVTIRVLMRPDITPRQKLHLLMKEAKVGFANGLTLGVLAVVFIALYLMLLKGQGAAMAFGVSLCTGAALIVSIILSSIAGTVIPMVFDKLKIDPAVASGPLITTVNDLIAVVSYYGLAWLLLIGVMGL